MNDNNRVTKALFWSFLDQSSSKIVAMIVQIVLARILAPDAFGLLAVLLVVVNIAGSIAQSGFGSALIQKRDVSDRSYDTAFWMSMAIALALYIILFTFAPIFAAFYEMPELVPCLRILSLAVFFNSANSIQRSYMQKNMDFRSLFRVNLSAVIGSGVIGVALALLGAEVWALVAQTLTQSIVTCVVMVHEIPWRPRVRFRRKEAAELFSYGWKICITGILNTAYTGVSELVIGKTCPASALGYYSQGRKYPLAAIGIVSNAIANVLFPAFVDVKNDMDVFIHRVKRALSVGTFLIVPTSLLVAVAAEPIVALLLTEKWLPCVLVFKLACIPYVLLMFQLVNLRAYMALGRSGLYLKLQTIKIVIGIVVVGGAAFFSRDINTIAVVACIVEVISILFIDMRPAGRILGYGATAQIRDQLPTLVVASFAFVAAFAIGSFGLCYILELLAQIIVFIIVYLAGSKLLRIKALDETVVQLSILIRKGTKQKIIP